MANDTQNAPSPLEQAEDTSFEQTHLNDMIVAQAAYTRSLKDAGHKRSWWRQFTSPLAIAFISIIVMVSLASFGFGASLINGNATTSSSSSSTSSSSMNGSSSTATTPTANVPNATQTYGGQLAKYTVDKDGAKHFTFTAEQVMWEVVKGHRVLAWTINGTVPGPMIRVTAGDHVRVTLINHFPVATAIHWHGLEVPSSEDGVPGIGMNPVKPGQTYTYDFSVSDQDVGSHWYHSHYDDAEQLPGGLYGAFVVDPRPGTVQAKQAIHADVEYTEFISSWQGYYMINGKSFPDTQPILVKHGQTVHMRIYGADAMMSHPMHLHGHTFSIVDEDGHPLPQPIQRDTLNVSPGESYDITFYAWAAPGSIYPWHCHILSHLMNPGQTGDEMGGLIALVEYQK
ncbi:MAG TPA: multicopper oxidase domain-containing protein [Ktedonobacteraceae bacterium]|nr:multicopper oxidase domain-containing protein [Ktedonobacteraceae bacterium]